jgi:Protein of unknown function (DUF3017)
MTPAEAATAPDLVVVKTDIKTGGGAQGATVIVEAEGALAVVDEAVAVEPQARKSGVLGELPLALVISGVGAGLVVIALHHFRWGNLLIAGSLLAGALFRSVLPTRRAGLLAVRARLTDVVTMAVMGAGLLVLALITST